MEACAASGCEQPLFSRGLGARWSFCLMKYEVWRGFASEMDFGKECSAVTASFLLLEPTATSPRVNFFQGASVLGPGLVHFEILLQSLCLLSEIDIHVALSSERPCLLRNASKPAAWN